MRSHSLLQIIFRIAHATNKKWRPGKQAAILFIFLFKLYLKFREGYKFLHPCSNFVFLEIFDLFCTEFFYAE